jgi:CxxC motif-containing protein (DUF1111 family)
MMEFRQAEPGEWVMHVKTREIALVRFGWDNGNIVVKENMP